MPIMKSIDTEKKRITVILSGRVSFDEMVETISSVAEDPSFRSGFDILSDHTGIEEPIRTDQAKKLAAHIQQLRKYFAHSKWAVVTEKEASYGMMRMLSVLLERIPMDLQVFYSLVEAEAWLSLPKKGSTDEKGSPNQSPEQAAK